MSAPVEIHVLNRKVRLLQPDRGFRTSLDSVMLAAACPAVAGDRVLDLGSGVGGASFCLLHRVPGAHVTGLEFQPDYAALAQENIALNDAAGRAAFLCVDIRSYDAGGFAHVICNPPYLEAGTYTPSPDEGKALALGHRDDETTVKDWVDAAFRNLVSGGSLTMIHRADMTDKIILAMGRRFGAIELIPLWPRVGEAAKRVVIRAVKDRRSPLVFHAGLVLHGADGQYSGEADAVLRDGRPI